jgi:hypothetical protein
MLNLGVVASPCPQVTPTSFARNKLKTKPIKNNTMQTIFLNHTQKQLLFRAFVCEMYDKCVKFQHLSMSVSTCDKQHLPLEDNGPKKHDIKTKKASFEQLMKEEARLGETTLKKLSESDELVSFTIEEIKHAADVIHRYAEVIKGWLNNMDKDDCDVRAHIPVLEVPGYEIDLIYFGFLENKSNLDFFQQENEDALDIIYYLRNYYPNNFPKSKEEEIDSILDIMNENSHILNGEMKEWYYKAIKKLL